MWRIKEFFRGLSNFWRFRKEIYSYKSFEYESSLVLFAKGLEGLAEEIRKTDASSRSEEKYLEICKTMYCIRHLTDYSFTEKFREETGRTESDEEIKRLALKYMYKTMKGEGGKGGILSWWI